MDPGGTMRELLQTRPDAIVAAIDGNARMVPVPPSVALHGHPAFTGPSGMDLVVADDRIAVLDAWRRAQTESVVRSDVHLLADAPGPIVAVTDFMKLVPEQIARFVHDRPFVPLGTDGFGRSDTREALRRFFEIDAAHVVVAVLAGLAAQGDLKPEVVTDAISRYGIDPEALNPVVC